MVDIDSTERKEWITDSTIMTAGMADVVELNDQTIIAIKFYYCGY